MSASTLQNVRDIRSIPLRTGEARQLRHSTEPSGDEPDFYAVHTRGDYLNASPRWLNRPNIDVLPRPAFAGSAGIKLSTIEEGRFEVAASAAIADLYYCAVGLWVVSDRLLEVLLSLQPNDFEHRCVSMQTTSGVDIPNFNLVMPSIVLDAVDPAKTDITIEHVIGGPTGQMTIVRFDNGYLLKTSIAENLGTFREEHAGNWLWRRWVFDAAAAAGVTGVLGKPTARRNREEIVI